MSAVPNPKVIGELTALARELARDATLGLAQIVERMQAHARANGTILPDDRVAKIASVALDIAGRPAVDLAEFGATSSLEGWRDAEAVPWLVEGVAARGSLTLLTAKGGAGKSLLTLDLILRVAGGDIGRWLDAFSLPPDPLRVLLVDAENGLRRTKRRIRELVLGQALIEGTVDLAVDNITLYAADHLREREALGEHLGELIRQHTPDLVLLDPLRSYLPASVRDENDNASVGRFMDLLVGAAKRHHVALIVADHDSKAGLGARGASAKRDAAELVLHLVAPADDDPDYLELISDKGRDPGTPPRVGIQRVRHDRTPEGLYPVRFEWTEIRVPEGQVNARLARQAKIARAVQTRWDELGQGSSVREIESDTGFARSTVHRELTTMVTAGLLFRPNDSHGYYPPAAREQP